MYGKVLLIYLVTTILGVSGHKEKAPRIIKHSTTHMKDCKEDPLSPCIMERIVIENPLYRYVDATVSCGNEFDEQVLELYPRARQEFVIELTYPTSGSNAPYCKIDNWKVK